MEAMMKNDMYAEVVTVTPEIADMWLKLNKVNRGIRKNRVDVYAEQMKKGEWQLNGQGISFGTDGSLIDGQHRLNAVIKAGVPVRMLVIHNVEASVFDLGVVRNEADILFFEGMDKSIANYGNVAMAKLHYETHGNYRAVPINKIRNFLTKYMRSVKVLSSGTFGNRTTDRSGGVSIATAPFRLACLYAMESGISADVISDFAEIVRTGFCFDKEKSAAIVLRNDIISQNLSPHGGHKRVKMLRQTEKAISDFCAGVKRVNSYKNWEKPVYSSAERFMEDE